MNSSQEVRNIIINLLKSKGKSPHKMFNELGINRNMLVEMQSKGSMASAGRIGKIAEYLDVSVDFLLGLTDKSELVSSRVIEQGELNNAREIRELILQLLKEKNILLSKMLIEIGLNSTMLNDMERKNSMPSAHNLGRIAEYLGVSVDYLLGRTNKPEVNV